MAVDKCSLVNMKAVKSCYYPHKYLIPQKGSLNRIAMTDVDYLVRCLSTRLECTRLNVLHLVWIWTYNPTSVARALHHYATQPTRRFEVQRLIPSSIILNQWCSSEPTKSTYLRNLTGRVSEALHVTRSHMIFVIKPSTLLNKKAVC